MVLGIYLGTTYSVAAFVDDMGEPRAIYNAEGKTTTPLENYVKENSQAIFSREQSSSEISADDEIER